MNLIKYIILIVSLCFTSSMMLEAQKTKVKRKVSHGYETQVKFDAKSGDIGKKKVEAEKAEAEKGKLENNAQGEDEVEELGKISIQQRQSSIKHEILFTSKLENFKVPDLSMVTADVEEIISYAKTKLGCRYAHGSRGPFSFDCSGYTHFVFKKFGVSLSPSSAYQYTQGVKVAKQDMRPGDLVFYNGRRSGGSRVGHVGMVTEVYDNGTFKFIHAACSTGVTESMSTEAYYSKRFVGVRRVVENKSTEATQKETKKAKKHSKK